MTYIKPTAIRKKLNSLGMRIGKGAILIFDEEMDRLIHRVADTAKADHRKTVLREHFYLMKEIRRLVRR